MFRKKKPISQKMGLCPCLSGEKIFESSALKKYFNELKNLISCPDDIYQELYLSTLYRLAEFCQQMPCSESSNGLLERQLNLAVIVLKLRRGMLLPKNAGTETIAAEEAQWTYALFSASLLRHLHHVQDDREIKLHYESGEVIGTWSPLSGSLYERNLFYSITFAAQSHTGNFSILMAAISGRIIPPMAFRWLEENSGLFHLWWSAILHDPITKNEIENIIKEAEQRSGIASSRNHCLSLFSEWITQIATESPELVFRTKQGVFVSDRCINDFLALKKISKTILLQELEKTNWLIMKNHSLAPKKFDDRRVLHGMTLNSDLLPEAMQKIQLNNYFVEVTPS